MGIYFTNAELNLLVSRKRLKEAQRLLAEARRHEGHPSALVVHENNVKVCIDRTWNWQRFVASDAQAKCLRKVRMMDLLS